MFISISEMLDIIDGDAEGLEDSKKALEVDSNVGIGRKSGMEC